MQQLDAQTHSGEQLESTGLPACWHLFTPVRLLRLAVYVLFPNDHYSLYELGMWDEPHYPLVPIHHDYRRADVRVFVVQSLDPVSLQLRIERHDHRILARVRLHLARLR